MPFVKRVPEGGSQTTGGWEQLSVAFTAKVTNASHLPGSVLIVMFAGQAIVGRSLSTTRTAKEQLSTLPEESVAMQVTIFVPSGKLEPLGGSQTTSPPGQLSVIVGANFTTASQRPGA